MELLRLKTNLNRLPTELIEIIRAYSYYFQPIEIRNDILSYFESKATIRSMFWIRYQDLMPYERNADMNWLVSDVLCYMNRNRASFYKYQDQFYAICKRNYILRNAENDHIQKIVNESRNKNIFFQFNVYWGLLNSDERNHFIEIQKKIRY